MIIIMLIQQSGCVTSTVIPTNSIPPNDPRYAYAVHCHKVVYIMEKIAITNDTLSGKLFNPDLEILQTGNFIHIYPDSDTLVKINTSKILSLPLAGIKKVKSTEEAPRKTVLLVIGGIVVTVLVLAGIALSSSSSSMNIGP